MKPAKKETPSREPDAVYVEGVGPVEPEKRRLQKQGYPAIELLHHFQSRGKTVLKSWQTTRFIETCQRNIARPEYKAALENYLGGPNRDGDIEVQQDIIAHADARGRFSGRIKNPAIQRFEKPGSVVVLQDYRIVLKKAGSVFEKTDFELRGGTILPLKHYPSDWGELKKPLPELGLPKGAVVFINNSCDVAQGLRHIYRSFWLWPEKRYFCTVIQWRDSNHGNLSCRFLAP